MAVVIAIGMPENASERRGIRLLAEQLPSSFTLYHNLELPTPGGLPYEYDQIIVGPQAVYVIEVKGYQGEIHGNASEWRLNSSNIVKSPLPLLNKKAKVLAERLHNASVLLKNVWVQPLLVLTDDHVRVNLKDEQADRVLHLEEAALYMTDARRLPVSSSSIAHLSSVIGDALMEYLRPLQRAQEIGDYRIIETVGKNNLW